MAILKLLILDVDGVLTTGQLPYPEAGTELKLFHVQDGAAIKLWRDHGGIVAILSGRRSPAVERRAKELSADAVIQGVTEKVTPFVELCARFGVSEAETAVVGDDWLDVPLLRRAGCGIAVANALPVTKRAADYVTRRKGGEGAIAEVVEHLLRRNGTWRSIIAERIPD